MKIKQTIAEINRLEVEGVIERYAIGGAVGATFYLEPVSTLDVDVFIVFRAEPGSLIASPKPIFDFLMARGARMEGEHIVVADWPVQFLPAHGLLLEEALREAIEKDVAATPVRVCTAEHLAAIALQTGRPKDKARLLQFIEAENFDIARFRGILSRHGLSEAWNRFERQFLHDQS